MPVLTLTATDLAGLFLRILPRGRVWPKYPDALQPQAIQALMPPYARLVARDNSLLIDTFPNTTVETLPEWEASLGLPDPCAGPDPTIEQRQAHVVARLTQQNGPSVPSLIGFAASLGFTITIQEFAPARYGRARYGDRLYGRAWAHAWRVTQTNGQVRTAQYGSARQGDPYRSWGNGVLECELRRLAPAHTVLQFSYADVALAATWDGIPGTDVGTWAA